MDSCTLWSFSDELEKIAKARATARQLRKMVKKLYPEQSGMDLHDLRDLRIATHHGTGARQVPLKQRLESYKQWKKTGTLPRIENSDTGALQISKHQGSHPIKYVRSKEPVKVFSGGGEEGLERAVRSPGTPLDSRFVIPGQQRTQDVGLYAAKDPRHVGPYIGKSPIRRDTPAVAEITVPRSNVVEHGYETVIPGGTKMKALIRPEGYPRGFKTQTPTIPR